MANVITRAVGVEQLALAEVTLLPARRCRLLLCSDGLSDELPARTIGRVLAGIVDPHAAAARLVELALAGEARDNVTARRDRRRAHHSDHTSMTPYIDFCGETAPIDRQPFTIGRDADFVLDDGNRHLHRQFLSVTQQQGVWLLANVGSQLTATVSDVAGRLEAFLAPGAVLPLVFDDTVVRFTAGPTTYEFSIHMPDPAFVDGSRPSRRSRATPRSGGSP